MAYKKKGKKEKKSNQSVALPDDKGAVADEEHGMLVTWVNEADDATNRSRLLSEKSRAYYDSEQWSDAEKQKLASQKQAATVINRCKPKVDSLMGMERANRTTAKAYPRTPKHTAGATAATEAVRFCLQDNMYERCRSDMWENMLIEGTGGVEVIVKAKEDDSYKIVIRHIMWDRLIYDPHSRRKDFSDAKFLGQVVWMDYDDAAALYPSATEILEDMQGSSSTYDDRPRWMDNTRRRVKIVEMYYRKDSGDWWYACFTRGGYCKEPMKSPYVNEEGETEHCYEFGSLFVDREGGRYGSMKQILDVQDEINKRRSKALHLHSVRQTFGTKGSVEDVNKARAELAKPDGHVEFAYGEFGKDFGILPTGDMAQAQFNLLTEAKMEIDSVGANAATQGKDKNVQSGVALRQRALTGQTELAPMFDMLKNMDIRIYRKVWNRIKQYWKSEMWLRVTDDEQNLKFVGLNKPMTQGEMVLKQAQEQGAPPEMLQQLQQKIASDPMMQQVVSTENDIVNLDVDIVMDDAPDTVTQEVEDFQAMAEMVKSGFPMPPEAVIMASPLSNKDKIIKMMKEQPQMSPEHKKQMEQAQEQMQKLSEENQALKADQQTEMVKLQAKQQADMQELEHKKQMQALELQLEREKAQAEIEIETFKVKSQLELESAKLQMQSENENRKCQMDAAVSEQKMAQDEKMNEHKIATDVKAQETKDAGTAMPQFLKALDKIMEEFGALVEANAKTNAEIAQALSKPPEKKISLDIQRNAEGFLVGGTATVQ